MDTLGKKELWSKKAVQDCGQVIWATITVFPGNELSMIRIWLNCDIRKATWFFFHN